MSAKKSDVAFLQTYPVLPLRQLALLPGMMLSVDVGRKSSVQLLEQVSQNKDARILVATQLDSEVEDPTQSDLSPVGVEAEILKLIRVGADRYTLVVKGLDRHFFSIVQSVPFLVATLTPVESSIPDAALLSIHVEEVKQAARRWVLLSGESGDALNRILNEITDPLRLADVVSVPLDLSFPEQLELLGELDEIARLKKVHQHLLRAIDVAKEKKRIDQEMQGNVSNRAKDREAILREQLKRVQEELGEEGTDEAMGELSERLSKTPMPDSVRALAKKQLRRLNDIPQASPEHAIQRTYIDWICDLPWSTRTEDPISMEQARAILDADHAGLEKVKKRILEYVAVRKLAPSKRAPILCLVGPPGVGKTSLAQSIARALGRRFARISLGGVRDEAEIRGHRRTYVGALPGRFIQALKKTGTKNPVILLDEVDKIGLDYRGDPASALLEVLDPEQNREFADHYLEIPFDLSEVLFCATANGLDTIPEPLLDRMEVIEISGYTQHEKKQIAQTHLIPKQTKEHGLVAGKVIWTDDGLDHVIEHYTREAGVRQLEREVAAVCRALVADWVSSSKVPLSVENMPVCTLDHENLATYLGPIRFDRDPDQKTMRPGMVAGLAWTAAGGEVMWIEVDSMPGKGNWIMTGKLGEVMRESVQTASSWVRSHAPQLGLSPDWFEKKDIHLHIPHGAIPKEGPSAGVAMVAALVSQVTANEAYPNVAMTGEITLRGRVLPVGGIKEKVLAAHRAGIEKVILPRNNAKDVAEIPEEVKSSIQIVFADRIETVLEHALQRPWNAAVLDPAMAAISSEVGLRATLSPSVTLPHA